MAPAAEYSGDHVVAEDCNCKDLLRKLDSVLKASLQAATLKAEDVFRNEINELLSDFLVPEATTKHDWPPVSILKQNPSESRTTAAVPADDRIHFALIRAIVLVTVIAIVLITTCKLVLQFITRTYRISH